MKNYVAILFILLFGFACAETQVEVAPSEVDFEFLTKWGVPGENNGQFLYPAGIAVYADKIYVVDGGNSRVQYFDLNGRFLGKWGSRGNEDGNFYLPSGIFISEDQIIYITDTGNARIQWFDLNGNFLGKFESYGTREGNLSDAAGIASAKGRFYIADNKNSQIKWFDFNGDGLNNLEEYKAMTNPLVADSDGDGYIDSIEIDEGTHPLDSNNYPGRLTDLDGDGMTNSWEEANQLKSDDSSDAFIDLDGDGLTNLLEYKMMTNPRLIDSDGDGFSDSEEKQLGTDPLDPNISPPFIDSDGDGIPDQWEKKFGLNPNDPLDALYDHDPKIRGLWGSRGRKEGQFFSPVGIKIYNEKIYISDSGNSRIQWFDLDANFLGSWGEFGSDYGQITGPGGIDIFNDVIYIVDTTNHLLQGFDIKNSSFTFINKCGCKGSLDSQFFNPYGITIDKEGIIYISDQGNHRIQKFRRK